jgi:hypothetical protein
MNGHALVSSNVMITFLQAHYKEDVSRVGFRFAFDKAFSLLTWRVREVYKANKQTLTYNVV